MSIFFFFKCSHTTNSQFRHRQKKKRQKKAKEAKAPRKNTLCAVLYCAELWPRCTARSSPYHIQTHFSYLTAINFPTNGASENSVLFMPLPYTVCRAVFLCSYTETNYKIPRRKMKWKNNGNKKYNDSARLSLAQCCSFFAVSFCLYFLSFLFSILCEIKKRKKLWYRKKSSNKCVVLKDKHWMKSEMFRCVTATDIIRQVLTMAGKTKWADI